jgi:5-methylcytosine-specific restriction enzyme subunit McrC
MLTTETGQLMERGQVACRFEEHTMDTPRNRLVRAALENLAARISDSETSYRCRSLAADFSRIGVSGTRPSRVELAKDQIARNETDDRLMVALSRMIFDGTIPTKAEGMTLQPGDETTEHLVRRLFERAVGNALRLEMQPKGWTVTQGRRLNWPYADATTGIPSILPGMQTDIELNHVPTGRRIVIDTKFTHIFTASNYRDDILKSGYLYQLYTYLRTQEAADDQPSLNATGILLHPQVGGAVDEEMKIQGHSLEFRTIDLAADAGGFENAIENLSQALERARVVLRSGLT